MKLTKEQAIEKHREMWNWITDKIIEEKNVQNIYGLKQTYCENKFPNQYILNYCFLCEYSKEYGRENCSLCPLDWESKCNNFMCEDKYNISDGLGLWWHCQIHFDKWLNNWEEQAALARQIANLPERVE